MSDQTYVLILRLLHIVFGTFWAGSVFFFTFFLIPTLKASGPEGGKFMQNLGRSGYPIAAMVSAIITIVAGFLLIWKLSDGFQPMWFHSWYSRTLTIGAGMAFIAFIIGFTINRPAAARINKIGQDVARQGGPPTPEQQDELMILRKRIFSASKWIAALVGIAVIGMSIFRYVQ
ncbi:MAG: hypothetical protein JNK79_11500 [Chitinophagaceae bacterium]|nr:hypothetical protein [Chitinophagaceae bacterium]